MGYLKINTTNTGEVVVDASKVFYIKKTGQAIDLVLGLGDPEGTKTEIRVEGSGLTDATKVKFNQAVIEAQTKLVVSVLPTIDEVFETVLLDPA